MEKNKEVILSVEDFENFIKLDKVDEESIYIIARTRYAFKMIKESLVYYMTGELPDKVQEVASGWCQDRRTGESSWFIQFDLDEKRQISLYIAPKTYQIELGGDSVFPLTKLTNLAKALAKFVFIAQDRLGLTNQYGETYRDLLAVWFTRDVVNYTDQDDLLQKFTDFCTNLFIEDKLPCHPAAAPLFVELYVTDDMGESSIQEWLEKHGANMDHLKCN